MSICKHFWAAGMAFWMLIVIADRVFDVAVWHDSDIKTKDRESSFNQGTSASSPELSDWVAESDFFLYCLNGLKSLEGTMKRTHSCCHWWVVEGKIQDEVPKLVDICYWFIDNFQKEPPLEATKLFLQMKEIFAILFRYHGDGQLCHNIILCFIGVILCSLRKKWEAKWFSGSLWPPPRRGERTQTWTNRRKEKNSETANLGNYHTKTKGTDNFTQSSCL